MVTIPNDALKDYLQGAGCAAVEVAGPFRARPAVARRATGTNPLGIVKHALNIEVIYFGPTFGRLTAIADRFD